MKPIGSILVLIWLRASCAGSNSTPGVDVGAPDIVTAAISEFASPTAAPPSTNRGVDSAAGLQLTLVDASSNLLPELPCRERLPLPSIADTTHARVVEVRVGTGDPRPIRERSWIT